MPFPSALAGFRIAMKAAVIWFYRILGLGSLANGVWMLVSPEGWFTGVPAAVTDTGPVNVHFVHDLGVVFILAGLGAFWCAAQHRVRNPVHAGLALFFSGHALVHVAEILAGRLPAAHWWIDAPLVFLPAVLLAALWFAPPASMRGSF
jgi:hypothetical protein